MQRAETLSLMRERTDRCTKLMPITSASKNVMQDKREIKEEPIRINTVLQTLYKWWKYNDVLSHTCTTKADNLKSLIILWWMLCGYSNSSPFLIFVIKTLLQHFIRLSHLNSYTYCPGDYHSMCRFFFLSH